MDPETIWFVISAFLLAMYLMLDGFDLGVGMIYRFISKDKEERNAMVGTIYPLWDGNEAWVLIWGAGLFAIYPKFYAVLVSSIYLAVYLLVLGFILRATAVGFRYESADGKEKWDLPMFLGSFVITLVLGLLVGNLLNGLPVGAGGYEGSLLTLFRPFPLIVGLFLLAAMGLHGSYYLLRKTSGDLREKVRSMAFKLWGATVVLWLALLGGLFAVAPERFTNFLANPVLLALPLVVTVAALYTGYDIWKGSGNNAFFGTMAAIGATVGTVYATLHPDWIPSTIDPGYSLTIYNTASGSLTLTVVMGFALVMVPIILAYTAYTYYVFRGKTNTSD